MSQQKLFLDSLPKDGSVIMNSWSGGRTSAYMVYKTMRSLPNCEIINIFANTGCEHEKTLEFINRCDQEFGFNTIWLEAFPRKKGKSNTWLQVDYKTASRNGEPYLESVKKYGHIGITAPKCTDRLKYIPMNNWKKDNGYWDKQCFTSIGIRTDEERRVKLLLKEKENVVYPLIDWWPTNKEDVLSFWSKQSFDLEIPEYLGNCVWCFKKSLNKLVMAAKEERSYFNIPLEIDDMNKNISKTPMFRYNTSTEQIINWANDPQMYKNNIDKIVRDDITRKSSCDESCDFLQTEMIVETN